ncbi:MAG: hypothetical protein ACYCTV_11020 [Leptospirales bacterium]
MNSRRGIKFRQWATRTLQEHLIQGYTFNARLGERGMAKARQALDLLTLMLAQHELVKEEGRAVLEMVQQYARTFGLLLAYDENRLSGTPVHPKPAVGFSLDKARADIDAMRGELTRRGETTDLFGRERGHALAGILSPERRIDHTRQSVGGNKKIQSDVSRDVLRTNPEETIRGHADNNSGRMSPAFLFFRQIFRRIRDSGTIRLFNTPMVSSTISFIPQR